MRRVWSVVVVAVVSLLVFAGGASAAVVGLEARTVTGLLDSSASKSVTATCPAGKQVTGAAGFKTHGAFGEVRLLAVRPGAALGGVAATFREDETGFGGGWQPTAQALCVSPLIGMQRVSATSASTTASKSVTATCPTGKRLIGMGGETAGGAGQVMIDVIRPGSGLAGVTVAGREDQNGFAGSWTVTAYAICAVAPQGLQRVSLTGPVSNTGPDVVANCPAGKGLLGVGGEASGQSGQVSIETYASPFPGEPTRGVARGFEDEDGYAPAWTLTAYAICANTAVRVASTIRNSDQAKFTNAICPDYKRATGAGGEVTGAPTQVFLTAVSPYDIDNSNAPPTAATATGFADKDGYGGAWSVTAYAICSSPLAGLERVTKETAYTSTAAKVVEANCPAGKKVVGGGAFIRIGSGRGLILDDVAPNPDLTGVGAEAFEDPTGYSEGWSVSVSAVCASPPPGLQLVSESSEYEPDDVKRVVARCPTGKHLLGTGAEIVDGFGEALLDDLRPDAGLKSVTVTAFPDNGLTSNWSLTAHAICANY